MKWVAEELEWFGRKPGKLIVLGTRNVNKKEGEFR